MQTSFYHELPKPIVGIAPMDGITDATVRYIHEKYNSPSPDILYTEFASTDGVLHAPDKLLEELLYVRKNSPQVAQIFGKDPEAFFQVAQIVCELGFDGIDINMGCPSKNVAGHGGGAALIQKPELAREIIRAVKNGVQYWQENGLKPVLGDKFFNQKFLSKIQLFKERLVKINQEFGTDLIFNKKEIPVTVKTRIGFLQPEIETWIRNLLTEKPEVITIHGRTYKQMYTGKADWGILKKAGEIIHSESDSLFFANGDIVDGDSAKECYSVTNADGFLVGRATFGDPYVIGKIIRSLRNSDAEKLEKQTNLDIIAMMRDHADSFTKIKGENHFHEMRKHLAWYVRGWEKATHWRSLLVRAESVSDVEKIIQEMLSENVL